MVEVWGERFLLRSPGPLGFGVDDIGFAFIPVIIAERMERCFFVQLSLVDRLLCYNPPLLLRMCADS
jgi:hypothetical protein